ncbi:MAG TPA: 5-oxoprolinase subunit PxpA [Metalysinibacillus sp.]
MYRVDINCDLGEGFGRYTIGEPEEIFSYISSANIACGYHAGDPKTMRETVKRAVAHNVAIGAHPGLPDLNGFGRREMKITQQEAYDMVIYQVGALQAFAQVEGTALRHVKAHGALYNMAAVDANLAAGIAQAVYDISPTLVLFGMANSELTKAGETLGLKTAHEVFADRTYQANGKLTSRSRKDAIITDEAIAIRQVLRLIQQGKVLSQEGLDILLRADTVCVHGDGLHAVAFAKRIYTELKAQGIAIKAY